MKRGGRVRAVSHAPKPARAWLGTLAGLFVLFLFVPQSAFAQGARKPLSKAEVVELLTNDVPPARVEEVARQYGISFEITPETERELRDAGATDSLLKTLGELAPQPVPKPRPEPITHPSIRTNPVLLIESKPGGAQVYVDDEPLATTSPEGRLRLARLAPGTHILRLALPGFRDYEEKIELAAGETTRIVVNLEAVRSEIHPSAEPAKPVTGAGTTIGQPTAALGMFLRPPPEGQPGMIVRAVIPGSPAERVGLRRGFTVFRIGAHELVSMEDLREALTGHQPGDLVEITFSNGATTLSRRVSLVAPYSPADFPRFTVVHDHGPPAPNYCIGRMVIIGGTIFFDGERAVNPSGPTGDKHSFEFAANDVREAGKNGIYMANYHAFHIRLKNDRNFNFMLINAEGKYRPPGPVLAAIERAFEEARGEGNRSRPEGTSGFEPAARENEQVDFSVGHGVTAPVPIYKPDPPYSEKARRAKLEGEVQLLIVVDAQGNVGGVQVVKPLGMGLDEKAVETVRTWRFIPGKRNGVPVAVRMVVDITFKLF